MLVKELKFLSFRQLFKKEWLNALGVVVTRGDQRLGNTPYLEQSFLLTESAASQKAG